MWHVFFLLIFCLESQPLRPEAQGPGSLGYTCTDHRNTCVCTSNGPHALDYCLTPSWSHCQPTALTNGKDVALPQRSTQLADSAARKPRNFLCVNSQKRTPKLFQLSQNLELFYLETSSTSSTQTLVTPQSLASEGQKRDMNQPDSQRNSHIFSSV